MEKITINKLQNEISSVVREIEGGAVYEVLRYSKPVAYLVPVEEYEKLKAGEDCKKCVTELRSIAHKIGDKSK